MPGRIEKLHVGELKKRVVSGPKNRPAITK